MDSINDACCFDSDLSAMNLMSKDLEKLIDEAIRADFHDVRELSESDKKNQNYQDFILFLKTYRVRPVYQRVVYSGKAPVIPEKQYLIAFKPVSGLCFLASKPQHKKILCDEKLLKISYMCPLVHSFQYILIEAEEFRIWSYVPKKCSDLCPIDEKDGFLRSFLFER